MSHFGTTGISYYLRPDYLAMHHGDNALSSDEFTLRYQTTYMNTAGFLDYIDCLTINML